MSFKPCNRHLLLREIAQPKEEKSATILVPEGYNVKVSPYGVYEVAALADDCTKVTTLGKKAKVLVNNGMVEEVSVEDNTLLLVLENHVYGVFE
jgi:hypothetical protein